MVSSELSCNACKKRVPLGTMRYSKDGSGLVCEDCWTKQSGGVKLKIRENTFSKPQLIPKKKLVYRCKACSYKFSRASDFSGPRVCPNCANDNVIYDLPSDANELLKELDKLDI